MSGWLAALALSAWAGLGFAALAALAVAAAAPLAARGLRGRHPTARARAAWLAAAAPGLAAIALVAVCLAPGALGALGLARDHCTAHPEHPHLCLVHRGTPLTPPLAGLPVLGGGGLLAGVVCAGRRAARERRLTAALRTGAVRLAPDVLRVEAERPFSFAAGWLRPRIFVSRGLVDALPAARLAAVLEHERAHVRRRDALARMAARALSWPHVPGVRRRLLGAHARACERACDEEAGRVLDDRPAVAEAVVAVERLVGTSVPRAAALASFGGSAVAERVEGLLTPLPPAPRRRPGCWATACAAAAWLVADPLHHAVEHALALLFGA